MSLSRKRERLPLTAHSFSVLRDVYRMELESLRTRIHDQESSFGVRAAQASALVQRYAETERLLLRLDSLSSLFVTQLAALQTGRRLANGFSRDDLTYLEFFGFDCTHLPINSEGPEYRRDTPTFASTVTESGALTSLRELQEATAKEVAALSDDNRLLQLRLAELCHTLSQTQATGSQAAVLDDGLRMPEPQTSTRSTEAATESCCSAAAAAAAAPVSTPQPLRLKREAPIALSAKVRSILRSLCTGNGAMPDLTLLSRDELLQLKAATQAGFTVSTQAAASATA